MDRNIFVKGVKEKYPKELLDNRITIEGNVIACIWKDPLLIDEVKLSKDDFITKDGRFLFSLAKNLRRKHLNVLDEVSVLSNSTEEVIEKLNSIGGYSIIENMTDIISLSNWDSYSDQLYRENILIKLYDDGFNIFKEIEYNGVKIVPIKVFRKMTSEQVLDWYNSYLSSYDTGTSSLILEEEMIDLTDDFIKECESGEESGLEFRTAGVDINGDDIPCFPFLSEQIGGYLPGTFNLICGHSSTGKTSLTISILMSMLSQGEKILIITNEQKAKVFKINFWIWLLYHRNHYYNLTKKKFMKGDISDEDKKQLRSIEKYWKESGYNKKLKFISISDASISLVKKKIRQAVLREGITFCFYDTFKLDFGSSDKKEYLSLIEDSRALDSIAKKYNIVVLASLQLALNTLGRLFLDANCLSQSKQIKEVCETIIMMRTVYQEELDEKNKIYCNPFKLKRKDDKWIEEDYLPDKQAVWRAIFVDKSRSGQNSSDTGVGYLYKMLGSYCVFKEVAQARFKHGTVQ